MKRILFWIYLAAIHVALAAVTGALLIAVADPARARTAIGLPNQWIERLHAVNLDTDKHAPRGAAVFLGDSITQRLAASAVEDGAINYGIGSQTSVDLARHAAQYAAVRNARIIYLLVGVNDLANGAAPDFEGVLTELPDDVPLVWTAIMPAKDISGIAAANTAAANLCSKRSSCRFVAVPITDGDLEPDGVHLTRSGYEKWISALRDARHHSPATLRRKEAE